MIIKEQSYKDIYKDVYPLCQKHWEELGEKGGSTDFAINHHLMMHLNSAGIYKCFTVEYKGKYIGYCAWVLSHGIHSASDLYATTDAVFIDKEYRESLLGAGIKLLRYSEKVLKEKYKVDIIQFSMNVNYDLTKLLTHMGYEISEVKYSKKLGE